MTNIRRIAHNLYWVRTQVGFRKALKEYARSYETDWRDVSGYPKSYPALVHFDLSYERGCVIRAQCTPMTLIQSSMTEFLNDQSHA